MSATDDKRRAGELPVTAEVGDEGGSFADSTLQQGTFSGPGGTRRVEPKHVSAGAPGQASPGIDPESGIEPASGTPEPTDSVRHATEPPEEGP